MKDLNKNLNNPHLDLKLFPQAYTLANSLSKMFPEQVHQDNTVLKAKEILGEKCTVEEAKSMAAAFEYLVNAWLEEYEKKIFDKKTLEELLRDL